MQAATLGILTLLAGLAGCPGPKDSGAPDCDAVALAWVDVPAGSFRMGSPMDEVGRDGDEGQHQITLTRPFAIGAHEVTREQFRTCMGYDPSGLPAPVEGLPVESLSWHEAVAFGEALSEAEGIAPCHRCEGEGAAVSCALDEAWTSPYECPGYRLPTEAEWEYAARAGSTAAFHNGGNLLHGDNDRCDPTIILDNGALLADIAWFCGDSEAGPHPVGWLAPNAWGLHDVSGNVWEWVEDGYSNSFDGDPLDPYVAEGTARVDRGGSWYDGVPALVRSAARGGSVPEGRSTGLGFRLARTASGSDP